MHRCLATPVASFLLLVSAWFPHAQAFAGSAAAYVIERDGYGVPHIYAESDEALFRGMGYAVAEDRLWQLELLSRTGLGELSAIFDSTYVAQDRVMRLAGFTAAEIDSQFLALPGDTRALVLAYCDGVNDRIADVLADRSALLPFEFWKYGCDPSPWNHRRVFGVLAYLGRAFGQAGGHELERLEELLALGPEAFDALNPVNDPSAPVTITPADDAGPPPGYPGARPPEERIRVLREAASRWRGRIGPSLFDGAREMRGVEEGARLRLGLPATFGSYAACVDSAKSDSRWAYLLGAPQIGEPRSDQAQLGLEVDLRRGDWRVAGMTIAGVPAVVVGWNGSVAWSLTSGISDNDDLFIETVNPGDSREYLRNGVWTRFDERIETIAVRGAAPLEVPARRSVHGPVMIADSLLDQAVVESVTFRGTLFRWVEFLLALDRAETLEAVDSAAALCTQSFNILAATRNGRVGYWHAGLFQDRQDGVDPRLPHDGAGGEDWHGLLAAGSLPHRMDPSAHWFGNWNNKPAAWWNNGDNVRWVGWQHVQYIIDYFGPDPSVSFIDLKLLPEEIQSRGSYQQVIEVSNPGLGFNLNPPGQSAFVSRNGVKSAHFADQWPLYQAWSLKSWGFFPWASVPLPAAVPPALEVSAGPRPARREVTVRIAGAREGAGLPVEASVAVYDASGRLVRTLAGPGRPAAGPASGGPAALIWDGCDAGGRPVPPGVYFVHVARGRDRASTKVLLAP